MLKDRALSGSHWVFSANTVSLTGTTPAERSALMATTLAAWRAAGTFSVLKGWRDEMYTVYAPASQPLLHMERSACALFGVVTYGVCPSPAASWQLTLTRAQAHLTAYTLSPAGDIHIWTPRRNPAKQTYGGLLDNTVAGGMPAGLTPLETIVKEASEEASLDETFVRERVRSVGAVSYFYCRHKTAGGEEGLLQPEVEYCYDLLVGEDVLPVPGDDEVMEFRLWDVPTVKEELAKGSFKPNCALGAYLVLMLMLMLILMLIFTFTFTLTLTFGDIRG